jgi:hypothetical protein
MTGWQRLSARRCCSDARGPRTEKVEEGEDAEVDTLCSMHNHANKLQQA